MVTLPFYFLKRPQDFIAPLLNLLPEVGDKFYAVYEKMMELYKNYEEYHEKLNDTEFKQLKSIVEVMSNKIGSPYEENIYTKLITTFLDRLKSSKEGTKNILIIDDIDRIDPDHIFRLFNVFATHFDNYSNDNKFGFDQIVFVCDVENIRNIFKNRYGTDVDFSGYIDKFYSYDIFYFENSKAVIEWYLSNLKILKVKSQRYEMADSDSIKETIKRGLRSSGILLEYLIKYGGT